MKSIIEKTLETGKKIAMTAILTYGAISILEDEEERSTRIKEAEKTKRKKSKYKNKRKTKIKKLKYKNKTKAKVKKKIQLTNPQGFLQVYQMWFTREGINMSMEDLEKVHKKMITYCEKVMNKDGEEINSAYVKYIDDVTAK